MYFLGQKSTKRVKGLQSRKSLRLGLKSIATLGRTETFTRWKELGKGRLV